jgi:hypothetical protein
MQLIQFSCVALALACAPLASAQVGPFSATRIGVGDARLRVDLIEPYSVRWAVTIATPDNRLVDRGFWYEELVRDTCPQACWRRTMRAVNPAGAETLRTVNTFDARTLAPVSTNQTAPDGAGLQLAFTGRRVEGRQNVAAFFHVPEHRRDISGRLRRSAFEINNGPTGLYLALMPHAPMTTLRVPIIDVDADDPTRVIDADYRIFNRATIAIAGRNYEAIAIDAFTTYGYWQYWVVEEPPFVVRWIYVGPGGGRTIYNLAPEA